MNIEFLVEEPSAKAALEQLLPKLLGSRATWEIHALQGKQDLLRSLPGRLRGYLSWLPDDWRIVVLVDRDAEDCRELKERLEDAARLAGLTSRSEARGGRWQLVNRIAVEELEAWFLGDVRALQAAFPGVPATLGEREGFRDPDAIKGGTWQALLRVLQSAGYFRTGLSKVAAATAIAAHMDPMANRSRSFCAFRDAILELAA